MNPNTITVTALRQLEDDDGTIQNQLAGFTLVDTAAMIATLTQYDIYFLNYTGVTAIAVDDVVRPDLSLDQLAELAEHSISITEPVGNSLPVTDLIADEADPSALTPNTAYNVTGSGTDISSILDPANIAGAPSQITEIVSDQGSVVLSLAQAVTLENAALPVVVPKGSSVSVVDTAAKLMALSPTQLAAFAEIGVTQIAANDTPAVFSADQMQSLTSAGIAVVAPPNNPSQNDGTYDVPNLNGMTIDVTWDPSVASAPADFEATVEAGIDILENTILNKITINIDVGYGEWNGQALPSNISEGGDYYYLPNGSPISYSDLRSALAENETSLAGFLSLYDLPDGTSLDGQSTFDIGTAEAKALGLLSATDGSTDGIVGFGLGFSGSELIGSALHEITHAMGRVTGASALSLFRYTSPGNNDFTSNIPAAPSYFSIDGGVTKIADFGEKSDPSDFLNSPASTLTPNDPFDETIAGSQLTPQDLLMLNVLGFEINPIESFTTGYIEALTTDDINLLYEVGITEIGETEPAQLVLNIAQAVAFQDAGITLALPPFVEGGALLLNDSAADIEALSDNPAQIVALSNFASAYGVTELAATDAPVEFSLDEALAFVGAQLHLSAPGGVIVSASPTAFDSLSLATIGDLGAVGVTVIQTVGDLSFNVQQVVALEQAGIAISTEPYLFDQFISDTAEHIETLTQQEIQALPGLSPIDPIIIKSNDGPISFDVLQIQAIEATAGQTTITTQFGIADNASDIETLTADQITGLYEFGTYPVTITVTAGVAVQFDLAQALALVGPFSSVYGDGIRFTYDQSALPNLEFIVDDTAADFANLNSGPDHDPGFPVRDRRELHVPGDGHPRTGVRSSLGGSD